MVKEMKRWKMIIIGMIVGIMLISGCTSTQDVTAETIKDNMLQAIEEVASYKYSADVTATITMINESGTNVTETVATQNGEVDIMNKKLKQDNIATTTGIAAGQHWIIYLVNSIQYYGIESDGNITWTSQNTSYTNESMAWISYSALDMQTFYFEGYYENTTLERLSDEVSEGIDCYVLYLTSSQNQSGEDSDTFPYLGYASYEYEFKYWISKDTYSLIKTQSKVTADMSGWYTFGDADRSITTSEMVIIFYDYNVPVTIEVPSEALEESMFY